MYVRGLRDRIPANVRKRASKAGFREPDWYAGPLVDEEPHPPSSETPSAPTDPGGLTEDLDLKEELDKKIAKAETARQMSSKPSSLLSRLRFPWRSPARQADVG